jgi:SAM-dependent methyltransferase
VLEIGCGTGRVLIPTARAGVGVVGLDASARMLDRCREFLADEPEVVRRRVQLVEGDMRSFALEERFPLVTIPFRPFQHLLTVEDQLACLTTIHRHLTDDGRLVFDLFNPSLEALVNRQPGQEIAEGEPFGMPDGRRVARSFRIVSADRFAQVNQVELIYDVTHPNGRHERAVHSFPMRYLFRFEAEHLLALAGFAVERLYADFDRSPFGSTYPGDLVFIARKA